MPEILMATNPPLSMPGFCPIPHTPRDQVWITVGFCLGAFSWSLIRRNRNMSSSWKPPLPMDATADDIDGPGVPHRVLRKAETVLASRTSSLVVVIEKTIDVHNYTAVLRTAEALGIQHVHMICPPIKPTEECDDPEAADSAEDDGIAIPGFRPFDPNASRSCKANSKKGYKKGRKDAAWLEESRQEREHNGFARTAVKWITMHNYNSTSECLQTLKADGFTVWATDLGQLAVPLTLPEAGVAPAGSFPEKLAIVFGTESTGCTDEMLDNCDMRVYLPLTGFADSLNLSVAAALILQRLIDMDPSLMGSMSATERDGLRAKWYPKLARSPAEETEYKQMASNPPKPFRDMRRATEHRVGWRGKKVTNKNNERYERLAAQTDNK